MHLKNNKSSKQNVNNFSSTLAHISLLLLLLLPLPLPLLLRGRGTAFL